jgi:hypothetical protein
MDSTDTLHNRSCKEDTNLIDSATLSGLEQRLYIKFKDSIRNERLREIDPIEEIEEQNHMLDKVNKIGVENLIDCPESHPQFDNLSQKLIALEKTCVSRKPSRPVVTRNRRVLGDIQQQHHQDMVPIDIS